MINQGDGKTLLCCNWASTEPQHGRRVVIATTEDEIESVMRPRLEAAGANLDLVSFVVLKNPDGTDDALQLPDHGGILVDAIEREKPSLFILDPMEAFLGVSIDSWKAPEMRRALAPISEAAKRAKCAAVVVGYVNRSASTNYLDRIAESMAFSRAARSALLLWPDPDDPEGESGCERILALGKTNIAPRSTRARRYRIETVHLSHIAADPCNGLEQDLEAATTARMTYSGESSMTANQLLRSGKKKDEAMPREPSASVREARDFLLSLEGLGRMGPVGAKDLFEVAAEYGLTQANLRTAARLLNDEAVEADEEPYIVQARRPEFQAGVEWRLARRYSRTRAGDIRTPNQWASVEMSGNQAESSTLSHSSPLIQEEIDLTETAAEEVYEPEIDADEAARIAAEEAHLESIAATGRIVPGLPEPPEATALITASVAGEHDAIPQEQSEFEAREPQWSTESGAAP